MSAIAVYIFAPPLGLGMAGLGVLFELAGWISVFKDHRRGEEKETWQFPGICMPHDKSTSFAASGLGPRLRPAAGRLQALIALRPYQGHRIEKT
jgi:hypothetical protein